MMWQPYFTGVGWDPFMDGAWGYYPGFGYMFASAYPWGWMPYRYGNWMMVPGMGWMWQPGGWNSWVGVPRYTTTGQVHVTRLAPPPQGTVKTVYVGRAAAMSSTNSMQPSRVTLNAGTAGLGIPRGSINHLNHLNSEVVKHGSAQVRPAPQFGTQPAARSAAGPGMRGGSSAPQRGSMSSAPPARASSPPAVHSGGGAPAHR
jgi:hypothetical protein